MDVFSLLYRDHRPRARGLNERAESRNVSAHVVAMAGTDSGFTALVPTADTVLLKRHIPYIIKYILDTNHKNNVGD